MTGSEIREKFLQYFERHGHTRVRSSPLLPANDPTLLFTNAGMNQFKDVFLGVEKREYVRACSSQKCLRAGGKHNDLDEVGKTARHQTFFEMLGNFSFGDYFKEDGIKFAWDLLVNEYKLDPARMWFTVFGGDEEVSADEDAEKFWEQVGAPRERILRFGRKDNFWQMGETGPCGPCSELHYYMGPDASDAENSAANVNGPGDTITELWNLVFMQFDRSEVEGSSPTVREGAARYSLTPLPAPSVDTGMGLERLTVVLQGVKTNYETDLLKDIVEFTAKLAGRKYEGETQEGFAMRVIADHARATAFSIADGILPGNEGRNYVLRKIMRRAIYQGRHVLLAHAAWHEGLFFNQVVNFVIDQMKDAYPELEAQREFIVRMVILEEQRFATALTVGLQKLDIFHASRRTNKALFEGANDDEALTSKDWKELAKLYDTFGTPRDLIMVSLEEHGLAIPESQFNGSFDVALQKIQGHGAHKDAGDRAILRDPVHSKILARVGKSEFTGYVGVRSEGAHVQALIRSYGEVDELRKGEEGEVVLDRTPFYAESGGQVGDVGRLINPPADAGGTDLTASVRGDLKQATRADLKQAGRADLIATVEDTYSPAQGLIVHKVKIEKGTLKVGDTVTAEVDVEKRDATRRNHTATHLMHAALREVLGTHVKQAGSVVAPNYLRFDFTHYQPLTDAEIEEIERLVNYHILRNEPVQTDEMAVEDAMRSGAMALFGEKYGECVRVLSIKGAEGIFSKELCGGTHVRATGDIGVFKITSDESIASGVRRIRAVTGVDAYERFREDEEIIGQVTSDLRTSRAELPAMIGKLQDELKKARREADELRLKIATGAVGSAASNGDDAREIAGVRVLAREASGLDAAGMRQLSDTLLARIKSGVVVLGRSNDGKASLIVRTSDDLTNKVPAGQVIKELAPIIGGKGGGKADMAEGGGNKPEKLSEALQASYGVIERMLS
ncbi:MAG TPA: alanine--tRNA ligase [Pyrinomonadaceae bacterium]|nr:alanine--tRNA ligase [Pyrinomonadaceae bacterium]